MSPRLHMEIYLSAMNSWQTDVTMSRRAGRGTNAANGYALLLVLFFVAVLVITVGVAQPNLITERRREKERELIWRGNQYVRGIRLYYQKTNRFPSDLEDLYKPKMGIRFMRQAYKDPMNRADGSWRLIYAGPNGQIMGSMRKHNLLFFGTPPPAGTLSALSASGPPSLNVNPLNAQDSSKDPNSLPQTPKAASGTNSQGIADSSNSVSTPQSPTDTLDSGQTIGMRIIGVGSKIDKRSVMWFEKEKNYLQFEFVWNGRFGSPSSGTPNP